METGNMEGWDMLLCALAGPAGSLLLALTAGHFPELALCALAQGVYNLLPFYPMDGGRILRSILTMLGPGVGERLEQYLQAGVAAGLLGLGFYGFFVLRLGLWVLAAALFPVLRAMVVKIPCKEGRKGVQ